MKKAILVPSLVALLVLTFYLAATYPLEVKRFKSPHKKYEVVVTAKVIDEFISSFTPTMPGNGGGWTPVEVEIFDTKGLSMGRIPVSTCRIAEEIIWTESGAEIKLIGKWDFRNGTSWYWSKDGNEQIWVKTSH